MAKFVYNNTKNASTSHTPSKLNYGYYPRVSFEDNVNSCLRFCFANKLAKELKADRSLLPEPTPCTRAVKESQQ